MGNRGSFSGGKAARA